MSVSVSTKTAEDQALNLLRLMADPEAAQRALKEFVNAKAAAAKERKLADAALKALAAERDKLATWEARLTATEGDLSKQNEKLRQEAADLKAGREDLAARITEHEANIIASFAEQDARSRMIEDMRADLTSRLQGIKDAQSLVEKKLASAAQKEERATTLVAAAEAKLARVQAATATLVAAAVAE